MKTKQILTCIGCIGIVVFLFGCNLSKSPISMVKKFGIWQFAEDDDWRGYYTSGPTWERVIEKYQFFEKYNSSNWSEQKIGDQKYLHFVNYSTSLDKRIDDETITAFIFNLKERATLKEIVSYFKKGVRLSENRTYGGHSVIYSSQDKARILEVITSIETGNVTDISFSNSKVILRWVTNKMADKDYGEDVAFLGSYIISDVKLEKNDGTQTSYDELVFYTSMDDPFGPYRYNRMFSIFD